MKEQPKFIGHGPKPRVVISEAFKSETERVVRF